MVTIWSDEVKTILSVGHPLEAVGVHNWALDRQQALQALDQLLTLDMPVSGGDVYRFGQGRMQLTYDNWYCDPGPNEARTAYAVRSIEKARDYISAYPLSDDAPTFFVLVPHGATRRK